MKIQLFSILFITSTVYATEVCKENWGTGFSASQIDTASVGAVGVGAASLFAKLTDEQKKVFAQRHLLLEEIRSTKASFAKMRENGGFSLSGDKFYGQDKIDEMAKMADKEQMTTLKNLEQKLPKTSRLNLKRSWDIPVKSFREPMDAKNGLFSTQTKYIIDYKNAGPKTVRDVNQFARLATQLEVEDYVKADYRLRGSAEYLNASPELRAKMIREVVSKSDAKHYLKAKNIGNGKYVSLDTNKFRRFFLYNHKAYDNRVTKFIFKNKKLAALSLIGGAVILGTQELQANNKSKDYKTEDLSIIEKVIIALEENPALFYEIKDEEAIKTLCLELKDKPELVAKIKSSYTDHSKIENGLRNTVLDKKQDVQSINNKNKVNLK